MQCTAGAAKLFYKVSQLFHCQLFENQNSAISFNVSNIFYGGENRIT